LAKKHHAELIALHMLELSSAILTDSDNEHQTKSFFYLKLAEKKLEKFLDKEYLDGIAITPIVKHYKVFSELNEISEKIGADLIVMGSKGASGMKEIFIGSNTEKVVRYSDVPVLVLKNEPLTVDYQNIVFASDFSDESIIAYINASKFLKSFSSALHLLYVNLPGEQFRNSTEMEKRVSDFLMKADGNLDNLPSVHYVSDYSIEQGILNFSNVWGADLIAVATHGRRGISHFFEGSVSESISNHSTLPVMTFKI